MYSWLEAILPQLPKIGSITIAAISSPTRANTASMASKLFSGTVSKCSRLASGIPTPNEAISGSWPESASQLSTSDFHIISSYNPWKPPSTTTILLRPVKPRAVRTAPMTASVPEFAKRIFSIFGHICLTSSITSESRSVEKPEIVPRSVMALITSWSMRVSR